jgi:serine acetyltransferase
MAQSMVYTVEVYKDTTIEGDCQIFDATTFVGSASFRFEQKPEVGEEVVIGTNICTIYNFRYTNQGITILCVQNGLRRLRIVRLRSVGTRLV